MSVGSLNGDFSFSTRQLLPLIYPIFTCVDLYSDGKPQFFLSLGVNTVVQGPSASSLSEVMRTSGFTRLAGLSGALAVGLGEPNFEIVKTCYIII